jgi:glc operon protein GlcG
LPFWQLDGRILGWFKVSKPPIANSAQSRSSYAWQFRFFVFRYSPQNAMKTKPLLEAADIKAIAAAAEAEALKNNWAVSIAIVDDGGHLLWLQRLDGAAPISAHIAPAKANTAALGRRESKVYEDMVNGGRVSFLSAPDLKGLLEGGVPILKDGQCLGAVGVSGVKSTEDAQVARAGIAAIGLA